MEAIDILGIIDTISAGFRTLNRKLWLIVAPIFLDLFLWLGPKLSIAPIVERTLMALEKGLEMTSATGTESSLSMIESMGTLLRETVSQTNLFSLLVWGSLGVPSIAGLKPVDGQANVIFEIDTYWQLFLAQALLLAVGLLIAALFLTLLARALRKEKPPVGEQLERVLVNWLYLALIVVPLGGILILGGTIGMLFGPLAILVVLVDIWLLVYVTFVPQAITLARVPPLRAIMSSFNVVRMNFWPTVGLLILTNVLNAGLGLIWQRLLLNSTIGAAIAIIASAYVGTALTLALFIFYQDRLMRLHELLQRKRSA